MDTQANNSLIKVEEFNQIMQSAPATLQRNQTSVSPTPSPLLSLKLFGYI